MLTSLCLSASIHSQMRLNTASHTLTIAIIPNCHGYSVFWVEKLPVVLARIRSSPSALSFVFSSLSFTVLFVQSLSVSVMMNQGEAVIGTALRLGYCGRSVSVSSLNPLPSLPPSLTRSSSLSNSCYKPFRVNAKNWPKRDMGQGQVKNKCVCV